MGLILSGDATNWWLNRTSLSLESCCIISPTPSARSRPRPAASNVAPLPLSQPSRDALSPWSPSCRRCSDRALLRWNGGVGGGVLVGWGWWGRVRIVTATCKPPTSPNSASPGLATGPYHLLSISSSATGEAKNREERIERRKLGT